MLGTRVRIVSLLLLDMDQRFASTYRLTITVYFSCINYTLVNVRGSKRAGKAYYPRRQERGKKFRGKNIQKGA